MKTLLVLYFIIFGFLGVSAQERFVRPLDEAKKDGSFFAFREKLISAVKRRDTKYLLGIVDRNIKLNFGGDAGVEDFKRIWKISSPKSKLWDELLTALANGGRFDKAEKNTYFAAPYVFDGLPDDLDSFEHQVIFGNNVNLRAQPDLQAKVIAQLSYNVVKVDYQNSVGDKNNDGEYIWLKVETLGGKKGFVNAKFVRSPIDYRAIFEKKGGNWKMTAFIAGD